MAVFGSGWKHANGAPASTLKAAASINFITEVFDMEPLDTIDEVGSASKLIGQVGAS